MTPTRRFPAQATSVAAARRFAIELLGGLPPETLDVVELMVSELATNCVRHAQSGFELRIASAAGQIRIEVTDDAGGTPAKRSPGPEDPHGRGLQIVEMFSDAWGVDPQRAVGKTVWFEVAGELAASCA
jgi:anti-sigma regulatory factor (Ser/Thr protein kinase)